MKGSALRKTVPLLVLFAAMAPPGAASAATAVQLNGSTVRATSDPGEANEIQVELDIPGGSNIIVLDSTQGVTVTPPCVLNGVGNAECSPSGAPRIIVNSGDGNDTIAQALFLALLAPLLDASGAPPIVFNGGTGNDRVQGGFGPDRIVGDAGNDQLLGFDGSDTLAGGPGNDTLDRLPSASRIKANPGRDRYFAGSGADTLRVRDFTRDLRIDCGSGPDNLQRDRFDPRPRRCP